MNILCVFQLLASGSEQFNSKPKKGIMFLQEHHLLSTPLDPQEVVHFLRENPRLDKKMIGEYISNRSNLQVLDYFVKWVTAINVWHCTLYEEFYIDFSMKCCSFIYDLLNVWTWWSMVWRCGLDSDRSHSGTGEAFHKHSDVFRCHEFGEFPDHLSKQSASEEALSTLEVICNIDTVNYCCNFSVILETR